MPLVHNTLIKKWSFEYWYFLIMIIYMAQMTEETSRMITTLSGNPIPFLIPIVTTVILLIRNPINWNSKKLWNIILIFVLWTLLIIIKYSDYSTQFLSYSFFLFYSLIIAFIHVNVYKENLFGLYEDIIVFLSKFSILLWLLSVIFPSIASNIFRTFPETHFGNNFLYVFNWMNPSSGQYYSGIMRNAGFSWEPGRYAIMICLAILFNIYNNGIRFKKNRNIIILLFALITTQSTTGYMITLLLYILFYINNISKRTILKTLFIILPIVLTIMQLDFMSEKIKDRADVTTANETFIEAESYFSKSGGLERHIALDRFQSMFFEWNNFINDPILGYSKDVSKSWFAKNFISDYSLTGGIIQILAQFGLIFGIFIYYTLFRSSVQISNIMKYKKNIALALCLTLSSISYPIFGIPVFTTFWLYGYYK